MDDLTYGKENGKRQPNLESILNQENQVLTKSENRPIFNSDNSLIAPNGNLVLSYFQ